MDLAASRCWTSLALKSGGSAAITALAGTTFSPKALRAQRGPLSAVAHSPPNRYIPYTLYQETLLVDYKHSGIRGFGFGTQRLDPSAAAHSGPGRITWGVGVALDSLGQNLGGGRHCLGLLVLESRGKRFLDTHTQHTPRSAGALSHPREREGAFH
jgi:hypothetical protein